MISFRVDSRAAIPPYQQIAQQVRVALRMGALKVGDKLPAVREVVAETAINPNTVLKAYRDLEQEGLVRARPGLGTFVVGTLPRTLIPALPGQRSRRHRGRSPRRIVRAAW